MSYHARIGDGPACHFVSRPGVFSYGRLDEGARALAEVAEVRPGDRILDTGCGTGAVGILAAQHAGPNGFIAFVDSNLRATSLAELNARANGVAHFQAVASSRLEGLESASFDVALANPPYFASGSIARLFVERSRELLKPDGRFYLVTRQPEEVAAEVEQAFGKLEIFMHRGYTLLCAGSAPGHTTR